jgi:hypothetical protein
MNNKTLIIKKIKMTAKSKLTITITAVMVLFGCTDKNAASEKNFLNALQEHYKNSNLCIEEALPLKILDLKNVPSFQKDFLKQLSSQPNSNLGRVISLEKAGLIGKPNGNVTEYELTELGKKYAIETIIRRPFTGDKPGLKFCYGKIKPTEIVNWDIPNSNSPSQKILVTYKYEIGELANWAGDKNINESYPQIKSVIEMQNKKEIQQSLKLTNTGWQVIE